MKHSVVRAEGRVLVPKGLDIDKQASCIVLDHTHLQQAVCGPKIVNRSRAAKPAFGYQGKCILIRAFVGLGGLRSRNF